MNIPKSEMVSWKLVELVLVTVEYWRVPVWLSPPHSHGVHRLDGKGKIAGRHLR